MQINETEYEPTGCRKAQAGFRQLPLNQYQQSRGLSLAPSLCRYSQSIP